VLFPPARLSGAGWLTALGAVAVAEALERHAGLPARIKWPNDVRVGGRKIAGVLVERRGSAGHVLGLGLNVNVAGDELPQELRDVATSVRIEAGRPGDRSEWARWVIRAIDEHYARGLEGEGVALLGGWLGRLEALGRPVRLETRRGVVAGVLRGVDPEGGLEVEVEGVGVRVVGLADVLGFEESTREDALSPHC
jgi:BirA family biotin operon repressor/biotin-[acetyl-CoA-carboxylase] ligase